MPTPQERTEQAFETIIGQLIGADVEHYDDGSRNSMVDALIHLPNGTTEALEVTMVADERALQMESFGIHIDMPVTPFWWDIRYPGVQLNMKQVHQHLPALIARLDRLDAAHSDELLHRDESGPDVEWWERTEIELRRLSVRDGGGRVAILPAASGGFVDDRLVGLPRWIEENQAETWWTSNVDKLAKSGHDRLHLAVLLHESGAPFELTSGLSDNEFPIDAPDPANMAPVTDLWLLGRFGRYVVHWSDREGWTRHNYGNLDNA